jgi:diphthamide biosynthesis methyltransferase
MNPMVMPGQPQYKLEAKKRAIDGKIIKGASIIPTQDKHHPSL